MKTNLITITENNTQLTFDTPGSYAVFFKNISGTLSCTITSPKVELFMFGLYDMDKEKKYTIHTEQIHIAPGSYSDLFLLSVMKDTSSLAFAGKIRIEKDAQKSHAYQKNQNLILSPDAFVDSRPILEILADDVFCTHGSTTGPLSKEQLLYLQIRGIDRLPAEQLLIEGFKNQVYDRIKQLGVTL
ncbi:MAG: SufD family Fe-S cluster assembly protein [Microgenomates group bacterium]